MKILKFGGKSLENGKGIAQVVEIIEQKRAEDPSFLVVVSARGNTTDQLERLLDNARAGTYTEQELEHFFLYQKTPAPSSNLEEEYALLNKLFEGVRLVGDYSNKIKDLVLAQGELLSTKVLTHLLAERGIDAIAADSRDFLQTNENFGNARINESVSRDQTRQFFDQFDQTQIPVVTGFIAKNETGETTTIGRNGSNYTAALLAKYLRATEFQNYTHVDGIYTADPQVVEEARILNEISYQEANELVSFGASVLHAKTITPLLDEAIPLRILNTFNPESKGTLIHGENKQNSLKSISVQKDVTVINIEGKGLLGKTGIDGRIFKTLEREQISIGVISQGSSERGVGLVINSIDAVSAITALKEEFAVELETNDISRIVALNDVSVVTTVGQDLKGFSSAYKRLVDNDIDILLINNTLSGKNISLVIPECQVKKAVNVIHSEIFGVAKRINLVIFGKGTVGGSLIDQILESKKQILERRETKLNIVAIVGSEKILFDKNGIEGDWRTAYAASDIHENGVDKMVSLVKEYHLENLIAIDNTASAEFTENYIPLIESGFDWVSSNKVANTVGFSYYKELRAALKKQKKKYLYETNVGAGLPLIDTIKLLHDSGENITKIKGVFSGSLSYLFNHFSVEDKPFHEVLQTAIDEGYTEPDPREDLCGNDVARKLLILARELELENEFDEIEIENLIPVEFRDGSKEEFLNQLEAMNGHYDTVKSNQADDHVLRYVGELSGDLQQTKGKLAVELVSVPRQSALGQVKGSDSIFEIYTDSYGDNPIVIQGAGAGAAVTARGVFGDILRIAEQK